MAGLIYPMAPMDQTWSEDSTIGVHNKNIKADKISGRERGCQITPRGPLTPPPPPSMAGLIYPMAPMNQTWSEDSTTVEPRYNEDLGTMKITLL